MRQYRIQEDSGRKKMKYINNHCNECYVHVKVCHKICSKSNNMINNRTSENFTDLFTHKFFIPSLPLPLTTLTCPLTSSSKDHFRNPKLYSLERRNISKSPNQYGEGPERNGMNCKLFSSLSFEQKKSRFSLDFHEDLRFFVLCVCVFFFFGKFHQ